MEATTGAERLITVLRDLKQAIRMADFARMQTICAELENILAIDQEIFQDKAAEVRRLVEETETCLAAAADGLRSGRRRLHEIAAARRGETYDQQGQRHGLPSRGNLGPSPLGRL
ncbi:hypothetical protein [Tabrizicola sp. M-4]|uniref:hypothetical protein n=1 Tax=Tabrizicola sp. M-4 TaxID=3055847 RepID=UPI003DA874EC